jgi:hypothetical protein
LELKEEKYDKSEESFKLIPSRENVITFASY